MNLERLEGALRYILDHPEQHNQGVWMCGTGACLAGHVVALYAGDQYSCDFNPIKNPLGLTLTTPDGERHDVPEVAQRLLNAHYSDVTVLFNSQNTVDMLTAMVKDIANDFPNDEVLPHLWSWDRANNHFVRDT